MAVRRAHLVGSIPAETAGDAMRMAAERFGPDLVSLSDGETGERRNWVNPIIDRLRQHPDLRLVRDGDWSDYDQHCRFAVRPGRRVYGASLNLGIAAAASAALPGYRALRDKDMAPPLFQVGIPGDLDLAMLVFGPAGPVRHRRPFTEALSIAMYQVHGLLGDQALFQIEVPIQTVVVTRAPAAARPALSGLLGRQIATLAQGAPEGARFGVHLCLGDLNHRALGSPADTSPLVLLANAIARCWPPGRALHYVHLPLAAADQPPSLDRAFYAPLAGLRLRPGARLIAGFAHEEQDAAAQFRVRQLIEDAAGHVVDISASCGLGRRQPDAAMAVLDRIKLLLSDQPQAEPGA